MTKHLLFAKGGGGGGGELLLSTYFLAGAVSTEVLNNQPLQYDNTCRDSSAQVL